MSAKRRHLSEQEVQEGKFCWEIESWNIVRQSKDNKISSGIYDFNGNFHCQVGLELHFSNPAETLKIGFRVLTSVAQKYTAEVFLLNNVNETLWSSKFSDVVMKMMSPNEFFPQIQSKKIFGNLIKDNKIKISCKVMVTKINFLHTLIPTHVKILSRVEPKKKLKLEIEKDKFEEILNKDNFSDIILKVGDQEIHAHKIILASKCPVFEAMFKNDMREKQKNTVNIVDIEYNIMKQLLRYIYTGSVEKIEEVAKKLLVAADKYAIEDLKNHCEKELADNINYENLVALIDLANLCNSSFLEEKIIDYIVSHKKSLVSTQEFEDIAVKHPYIMVKVCTKMALN